jgi:hypothetical protein
MDDGSKNDFDLKFILEVRIVYELVDLVHVLVFGDFDCVEVFVVVCFAQDLEVM